MADRVIVSGGDKITDPSAMTREALDREFGQVREIITTGLFGLSQILTQRLDSVDDRDRIREAHRIERDSILEAHRLELKAAADSAALTKQASDEKALLAALAAAKEAVLLQTTASALSTAKSETAIFKQMDEQKSTFTALIAGQSAIVNLHGARLDRMDGSKQGGNDTKASFFAIGTLAVAVLGLLGLLISKG